jgi:outer membrane protein TolC
MKRFTQVLFFLVLILPLVVVGQQVDYNKIILPPGASNISYEERLVQLAWQNNPASQIVKSDAIAAEHDVKALNAQWLRNIGVTANVNKYSLKEFNGDPDADEVFNYYPAYNVFLTLPLSTFFEGPHLKKAAQNRLEASEERVNQLKLNLRAEVLKRYNDYKMNEEIRNIRKEALADEESNYLVIEEKFKNGTATVESYQQSLKSRNELRIQAVESETMLIKSKLDLEALIGIKLEEVK